MVKSRLEPNDINYVDRRVMEESDKNFTTMLYECQLLGQTVLIALGQRKKKTPAVYYYPIYLVNDDKGKVVMPLGVYEVWAHINVKDKAGDVDLQKLGEPLLYSFVEKELKEKLARQISTNNTAVVTAKIVEQTKEEADLERVDKVPAIYPWIQKFMKNPHYSLQSNNNNNLFAAVAICLSTSSLSLYKGETEATLRKRVAKYATMPIFLNYKTIYGDALQAFQDAKERVITTKAKIERLKHDLLRVSDRSLQAKYLAEMNAANAALKQIALEHGPVKQVLTEYAYMAGVDTLDLFKLRLQTADFRGDAWALHVLERDLHFVALVFSADHFKKGDIDHTVSCHFNNKLLTDVKAFILVASTNNNNTIEYLPVAYKDKLVFATFLELPYDLRQMIALENKSVVNNVSSNISSIVSSTDVSQVNGQDEEAENHCMRKFQCEPGLCDANTVFQFYSKSLGSPWPGKGAGEQVPALEHHLYKDLASVADWRRQLDNFWPAPFVLDGQQWLTVEHYYQGAKFQKNNPDFRLQFTMESNSALSKDPLLAKYAGSKTGLFKRDITTKSSEGLPASTTTKIVVARPKRILRDPTFDAALAMEMAIRAKFTQHKDLQKTLRYTRHAKLMYFPGRGLQPVIYNDLMRIRKELVDMQ